MTLSLITRGSGVSIAGRQPRGVSPAFTRASAAYQSDGRLVGVGVPRFETVGGRRGVLVEARAANLLTTNQASCEVDTTGFLNSGYNVTRGAVLSATTERCLFGEKCLKIDTTGGAFEGVNIRYQGPVLPADEYTLSSRICNYPGESIRVVIRDNTNNRYVVALNLKVTGLGLGWSLLHYCFRLESPSSDLSLQITLNNYPVATVWYVDGNELRAGNALLNESSFSEAVREAEILTLFDVLSPRRGTIACWHRLGFVGGDQYLFANDAVYNEVNHLNVHIGSSFMVELRRTDRTQVRKNFPAYKVKAGEWQHWALVYDADAGLLDLYINGERVTDGVQVDISAINLNTTLHLSGHKGNMTYGASGLRSGLLVSHRALCAAEIASHMAGNIPSDCYHYPFDGDLWPAPGSLGAVVAPAVATRPGRIDVATSRGSADIITRTGKLEVISR